MNETAEKVETTACTGCGHLFVLPRLGRDEESLCQRCGTVLERGEHDFSGNEWAAAAAVASLILFLPAILLPTLEQVIPGPDKALNVWQAATKLWTNGYYFAGGLVFFFSIIVPPFKAISLWWLARNPGVPDYMEVTSQRARLYCRFKSLVYRINQTIGKFGLLEVCAVAFLVLLTTGTLKVEFGKAIGVFCLCVFMSWLGTMTFDRHSLWRRTEDGN